ncbi:uncharacterized protein LOC128736459 [Sabethes cyaneus]|uniref:uncharacterized protein LOC128736459 n=1 Tax=Sabethes cyaneus TaxID=53552 RepID=UPI00237E8397|nr:uncharacterized protein LOC128736459 [Sabethes cyaneus]
MSSATEESLLLYYQNACGMNTVIDDYFLAISEGFYDVIALTETWLDDRTLQSQLLGHEYEGFRCDRGPHNSSKKTGGGVLVAVRRSLKASRVNDVAWNNIEQVWVSIKLKDRNLYLCTIYIPPDRTRDKTLIESHLNSVLMIAAKAKPRDEIVIIGDFNFPNICWRAFRNGFTYPDPDHSSFHTCALDLLDGYSCSNLIQINCNANENGRCLDLCFVSASESAPRLTIAPVPLVKLVPHHPPLVLSLHNSQRPDYHETPPPSSYNFRQADYNGLLLALQNFNWSIVLLQHDINIAVSEFSLLMNQLIERFVPKSRSTPSKHPPWQTPELRRLKTVKRGIFRKLSANRNLHLREHYQHLNHAYRRLSRRCHRNYTRRMEAKLKSDPKRFWKFVNQQRKESSLPTTLEFAGETADNTPAICRLFATKFSSVFCNETLTSSQIDTAANNVIPTGRAISSIDFDDRVVLSATAKMKHSSSPGPDGIPATLIKHCITGLLAPISHLFRLSLASGRFPEAWKQAYMFPVFKKGDRTKVDNYRGISALCAVSKLFELVIIEPIFSYCQQTLANEQHGFLPKRSCTTNLLCFTNYVTDSFTERSQTDAIYRGDQNAATAAAAAEIRKSTSNVERNNNIGLNNNRNVKQQSLMQLTIINHLSDTGNCGFARKPIRRIDYPGDDIEVVKNDIQSNLGEQFNAVIPTIAKPKVKIVGMSDQYSPDVFVDLLKSQNENIGINEVKIIAQYENPRFKYNKYNVVIEVDKDTYKSLMNAGKVGIGHTGGVAIYARESIKFNIRTNESVENNWFLGISVERGEMEVIVCGHLQNPSASARELVGLTNYPKRTGM